MAEKTSTFAGLSDVAAAPFPVSTSWGVDTTADILRLPHQLLFYGHSYFQLVGGVLFSAGYRTDRLVAGRLGAPDNRIINRAVTGCRLLQEGAAAGGYANVLQASAKNARTAPYIGSDGTAFGCWGINDFGQLGVSQQIRTAFQHAQRTVISRHRAASVRENSDATVTNSGGSNGSSTAFNSGTTFRRLTGVGNSVTITLMSDFPGGTIALGLVGAAGPFGGTVAFSGTASAGTAGSLSTSNIMPQASVTHGAMVSRISGLTAADAGKTITATVTALDASGEVDFDYWQVEAAEPPLFVWCNVPRLRDPAAYAGFPVVLSDADIANVNADIAAVVDEFDSAVVLADIDAALGKDPALFAPDGVHPNELGARAVAEAIVSAIRLAAPALSPFQLTTDYL